MEETARYICTSCGEEIEIAVDPSAGSRQQYVEDCPVCCHPNALRVTIDRRGNVRVDVEPE
jgi:hypothetical protein